jgi:Type II secretion system (T2SS), protein E, N-terminal domain
VSLELARTLLLSEALDRAALARALRSHVLGEGSLPSALVNAGVDSARVDNTSAAWDGPSVMRVMAKQEIMAALPEGLALRLFVVPIRIDPQTGVVDVAVVDPDDAHTLNEVGFALQCQVRAVRAPFAAIAEALEKTATTAVPLVKQAKGAKQGTLSGLGPGRRPPSNANVPVQSPPRPAKPSATRTPAWGIPAATAVDDEPPSQRYEPIPLTVRRNSLSGGIVSNEEVVYTLEQRSHPPSEAPIPLVGSRQSTPVAQVRPPNLPRPPFADPGPVLDAMRAAKVRDDVMHALLTGVRAVALRVGLLVVKRDAFVGWSCADELCAQQTWAKVHVSTGYPSALATAAAEGTYLGSVQPSEAHTPLLDAVERASRDVAITPVKVGARAALLIYADELGDPALSTKRMEELARAAGEALARILRDKR